MDDRKVEAFDVLLKKDDADMKPSPFLLSERHILDRPPLGASESRCRGSENPKSISYH